MSESPIELRGRGGGVVFQGMQSPGGGSQPGAVRMLGPFSITSADLIGPDGFGFYAAPIYTPTSGDALLGFSWLLRDAWGGNFTNANIAPQTSADTGTAGPALLPPAGDAAITTQAVQGQGPGNTGGDYFVSIFLPVGNYGTGDTVPVTPSNTGPVISDGTTLYLAGDGSGVAPSGGQLDIYVYVATPAAP